MSRLPPGYPHALPFINELLERDRGDTVLVSAPAAAGSGTMGVEFEPVQPGDTWLIDRIVVSSTSSTATEAVVYDGDVGPGTIVGCTNAGNLDYDDTNEPYRIFSAHRVAVVWTSASDGAVGTARIQYRIMTTQFAQGR